MVIAIVSFGHHEEINGCLQRHKLTDAGIRVYTPYSFGEDDGCEMERRKNVMLERFSRDTNIPLGEIILFDDDNWMCCCTRYWCVCTVC